MCMCVCSKELGVAQITVWTLPSAFGEEICAIHDGTFFLRVGASNIRKTNNVTEGGGFG